MTTVLIFTFLFVVCFIAIEIILNQKGNTEKENHEKREVQDNQKNNVENKLDAFGIIVTVLIPLASSIATLKFEGKGNHLKTTSSLATVIVSSSSGTSSDVIGDTSDLDQVKLSIRDYMDSDNMKMAVQMYHYHLSEADAELKQLGEECEQRYINEEVEKSKNLFHSSGAQAAYDEIEDASTVVSSDKFSRLRNLYNSAIPIVYPWNDVRMDADETAIRLVTDTYTDSYGNEHENAMRLSPWGEQEHNVLNVILQKKYNSISGTFYCMNDYAETEHTRCKVYADNRLIFDTNEMYRTNEGVPFSLDVTNAYSVVFKATEVSQSVSRSPELILADFKITKNVTDDDIDRVVS